MELSQLDEYDAFKDLGKDAEPPDGYKKIRVHFVYACKHDGRRKARLVAGGHLTETPVDSVYSSVVSLQGIRTVTFLSELNGLSLWGTDIGNAYLESVTKEKIYFIAGHEFGPLQGHTLIIYKAQYGLRSSGLRWHEKLADVLRDMGFFPSKADEDIWMRDMGDHYEYIAVYVDDLAIASRDPATITTALTDVYKFKLKGTGPIEFHLGCDFYRDEHGVLCFGPKKYIEKMEDAYVRMFGKKPKRNISSPLESNDHPELDTSELLDDDGIARYQSIIGQLQWAVSLGRFDVGTAVMTMSSFRVAPRTGHLERAKRIVAYLCKMKNAVIRVRTGTPDYTDLPVTKYDWSTSVYGDIREAIPEDAPRALGKAVTQTSYVDANLLHDFATGRAVTGVLHFYNRTPIGWYTKKQATVETATYGAEFIAARLAKEQIQSNRLDLRYLGVPIDGAARLFGDNQSVVTSGSIPHSKLNKRHQALSYHSVREGIASGMLSFNHIPGHINPADILSKHWGYQQIWPTLKPILFWMGNTADLIDEEDDTRIWKGSNTNSDITSPVSNDPSHASNRDPSKPRPVTSSEMSPERDRSETSPEQHTETHSVEGSGPEELTTNQERDDIVIGADLSQPSTEEPIKIDAATPT